MLCTGALVRLESRLEDISSDVCFGQTLGKKKERKNQNILMGLPYVLERIEGKKQDGEKKPQANVWNTKGSKKFNSA